MSTIDRLLAIDHGPLLIRAEELLGAAARIE